MTTRATRDDPWGKAVNMGQPINSPHQEGAPWISPDSQELYFQSSRPGGYGERDIWIARRATYNEPWSDPINLGSTINTPFSDWGPSISPDGLTLYFSSNRPGGYGDTDMWLARRTSVSDPWGPPVNLGSNANSPAYDAWARVSPDGSTLYFFRMAKDGTGNNMQAPINYDRKEVVPE